MNRAALPLAVIAAIAVVWLQTPVLPPLARAWTAFLLVPLPALMVIQARQLRDIAALPRRAVYISSIVSLWVLALATLLVAAASRFPAHTLGLFATPLAAAAVWTVALTAAGIAVLFGFRALGMREAPILRELLPTSTRERALFVVLSISAGVCEEIAFRGFLLYVLAVATGSSVFALVLSSGAFGVLHAYQQPAGALRAALLGALLALPLLFDQPIYVPIVAHAAIDILAGLWLARFLDPPRPSS